MKILSNKGISSIGAIIVIGTMTLIGTTFLIEKILTDHKRGIDSIDLNTREDLLQSRLLNKVMHVTNFVNASLPIPRSGGNPESHLKCEATPTTTDYVRDTVHEYIKFFCQILVNETTQRDQFLLTAEDTQLTVNNKIHILLSKSVHISKYGLGGAFGCAVADGGALCWGNNSRGQLGRGNFGSTTENYVPRYITGLEAGTGVTDIGLGGAHACAIQNGQVKCWGYNGGSGNSNTGVPGGNQNSPQLVTPANGFANTDVRTLFTGGGFSCAQEGVRLFCWGYSGGTGYPITSTGATNYLPKPVSFYPVEFDSDGNGSLEASFNAQGAPLFDPTAFDPDPDNDDSTPPPVPFINGRSSAAGIGDWLYMGDNIVNPGRNRFSVLDVKGGGAHACALTDYVDGLNSINSLWCWGSNYSQQLGQDLSDEFGGGAGFELQGGAGGTTGFPKYAYKVIFNTSGSDRGSEEHPVTSNRIVNTPFAISKIAAGDNFNCALINGGVMCWGSNENGQLGVTGAASGGLGIPSWVAGMGEFSGVSDIFARGKSACAIQNSVLKCWGRNIVDRDAGAGTDLFTPKLGTEDIASNVIVPSPVTVVGNDVHLEGISLSYYDTDDISSLCTKVNGTLKCWGANQYGQLGISYLGFQEEPVPVAGLVGTGSFEKYSCSAYHCCVIKLGGLRCWGKNDVGQLGNNSISNRFAPTMVSTLGSIAGVTDVMTAEDHTCAIVKGDVKCWGANNQGQLGIGSSSIPKLIPHDMTMPLNPDGTSVKAIKLIERCFIGDNTKVYCWGKNTSGELGSSIVGTGSFDPIAVQYDSRYDNGGNYTPCSGLVDLQGVYDIAATEDYAIFGDSSASRTVCALKGTGVVCWGANMTGQAGDTYIDAIVSERLHRQNCARDWGHKKFPPLGPGSIAPQSNPGISKIVASNRNFCALGNSLNSDSKVRCWGETASSGGGYPDTITGTSDISNITMTGTGLHKISANIISRYSSGLGSGGTNWTALTGIPGGNNGVVLSMGSGTWGQEVNRDQFCIVKFGVLYCKGDNSLGQQGQGDAAAHSGFLGVLGL